MMINVGDKLTAVKRITGFLDKGDIIKVVDVDEYGMISFAFGEDFMHKGIMNITECEEYFEKVKEERSAPSITSEHIEEILANSEITTETVFNKCTIVTCKLPNGFVIVESSACVSPENYDEKMGFDICMKKITDKIWELEGYRLQDEIYRRGYVEENSKTLNCSCESECPCEYEEYEYYECPYDNDNDCCCKHNEEFDECLDTDIDSDFDDCEDCEDYDCPYNPNR